MKKKAFIPISALVGALLLAVIAAMTPFVAGPNLAYAQVDSDVATLSALRVSSGTLLPAFDPSPIALALTGAGTSDNPHSYTVNVQHALTSLTVSATKTDRNASVAFSGGVGSTNRITLEIGDGNEIDITVTAENAIAMKVYRVTVTRASATASTDATLMLLTVNPGMEMSPQTGDPLETTLGTKFEYSVDLPNAPETVTIAATVSGSGAVATVKKGNTVLGSSDTDGTVSIVDVAIDEGDNTITVEVLPPSFIAAQKKTYTLTINRARRNASLDTRLSSLRVSSGTLMPAFDASDLPVGTTGEVGSPHLYRARVPHNIVEITVMAGTMDSRAKWEVTAPIDSDITRSGHQVDVTTSVNVVIRVTAEDRITLKYYQVNVIRAAVTASNDATLSVLTVDPGMVGEADSPSAEVLDTKFEYSIDLPLSFVAAQKKTYTLTINRARRNASDDARLSSLRVSRGTLMPTLDATTGLPAGVGTPDEPHLYEARVPNSVESLTVMAEAMSSRCDGIYIRWRYFREWWSGRSDSRP